MATTASDLFVDRLMEWGVDSGPGPLRFLELFRSRFADVSPSQWLALTPPQLVCDHLHVGAGVIAALEAEKVPVRRHG